MNLFADIIVPLALPGTYTYSIPEPLQPKAAAGKRVVVSFGTQRLYSGIIVGLKNESSFPQTKDVLEIIDDAPVLNSLHLQFWHWLCDYYLCYPGEVMHAAMPTGMRFDSETFFSLLNDDAQLNLNDDEIILVEALRHRSYALKDIQKLLSKKNVYPVIRKLVNEGIITGDEVLRNQYKARTEKYFKLTHAYTDEQLNEILEQWDKRAAKQLELLQEIIFLSEISPFVSKKELNEKFPNAAASLKKLMEKNLIEEIVIQKGRLKETPIVEEKDIVLTHKQLLAFQAIQQSFQQHEVTLLHGVTSSGKTHIYIKLIEEMLQHKMQVLYMLPEIAITSQIIRKLKTFFGNKVGVYHSKFNTNERVEIWNKVLSEEYQVVLGVRSSLFLPFQHLGLIIVDEEHDSSYKQQDPSPRYHARDAAVMLGKLTDAKVLLGTATPSLETYKNVKEGKYGLVEMNERFLGYRMPEVVVVNTKEAQRKKQMRSHFSQTLLDEIQKTLNQKEQVILFQNRRGYAPFIQCGECSFIPKCKNCDVSLTYHKHINKLKCHLCGYTEKNHERCSACGSHNLKMQGIGTEKIEDEIALLFPQAKLDRLDIDAARGKEVHQVIIEKFETRETDILVGTQMVTKGLDFDHVHLVGIIHVDQLLNYPDFRSSERTFQLVAQVSGRAGRKAHNGLVILQTSRPEHPVVQFAAAHDYRSFYDYELQHRSRFFYPPFSRMIRITVKHKELNAAVQAAQYLLKHISLPANVKLLGPVTPVISRIKNLYLQDIVFKIPKNSALLQQAKEQIEHAIHQVTQNALLKTAQFHVDVDPY
jgi:primosomal protein N' (replication factor Y) (superfamily II helicase)